MRAAAEAAWLIVCLTLRSSFLGSPVPPYGMLARIAILCAAWIAAAVSTAAFAGRALAPAPFACHCDNATSATAGSLGNPVSLPGDLILHAWSGYETVWYIGQVSTSESPARRFGVLWMLYSGASPDGMCPSATTGAWAALAVPQETTTDHAHKHAHHAGSRRHAASVSSGPAPGTFVQDSRLGPSMLVSPSPFALWDAPNQWGLRQLSTSNDWQLMNMSVQAADQGFAFDLQLNASVVAMQAMGFNGVAPDTCVQHRGQPRIAATGTVTLGAEVLSVSGTIWSQHMWGISPSGTARSWRWYNAELSDGWSAQFVFFDAPSQDASYGNLISPDGSKNIELAAEEIELTQDPLSVWVSPRSGHAYNTSSTIRIPASATVLHYQTWIADNEVLITPDSTLPLFYEGVSDVHGTHQGEAVNGNGYTERFRDPH